MARVLRPWWWLLDYLYAGWRQLLSPFRRRCPDRFADGDPTRPAIVLLPGVYETWLFLEPIARRLNADGWRVFGVPELSLNRMPVPASADRVTTAFERLRADHGVTQCVLVAHSKGGLIGKYLMLAEHNPIAIIGMVAVAAPFSGSDYARYMLGPTLRAFAPQDKVLLSLSAQLLINSRIVSIFGEFDPHIPVGSSLEGALNVELPVAGHFRVLRNAAVLNAVADAVPHLLRCDPPGESRTERIAT
ncbi:MAG: alpha/beta hydrolase [Microbacteriaceae bacterium]